MSTNAFQRAAAATTVAAASLLTGCVATLPQSVSNILPQARPSAPVQTTVGIPAVPTPGAYFDKRGYERFSDNGAVVGAPTGSCNVMRQAAAQANATDRTAQQTGNQMGAYAQRGVQGAGNAVANGVASGNVGRAGQNAVAAAGSGIAGMAGAYIGGLIRGGSNENAQDAAKARYQAAYNQCGQEYAAQVDAQCAARTRGDRDALAYTTCFDQAISRSPAPALVPRP